ncbi:hypothetical protein P152DRAFT_124341 [Eremomyces bilateralis CBS 781.70]|uniref:Vacuolar import and degradation protein-domain-containing protein n=1 Tax=Eremomyces bilateralis CBS 781.70 TaxID=1392243 RepID=A0A6G1GEK5_9PEZI|nr:uncharacterized protein P152DRAFT_124341 [Eremomyces bilateralis CBS 781.70]KAF1816452.1 hypothetical protein P152DRAFT_124341 [Eremomyces bilateralis CBS 781.70]
MPPVNPRPQSRSPTNVSPDVSTAPRPRHTFVFIVSGSDGEIVEVVDPTPTYYYHPDHQELDTLPDPELAASLLPTRVSPDDEVDDANVSFLRSPIDPQDEWRAQNAFLDSSRHRSSPLPHHSSTQTTTGSRPMETRSNEDRQRRERLHRILSRLNRVYDTPTSAERATQRATESRNDWAAASPWEPSEEDEASFQEIYDSVRSQLPDYPPHSLRVMARDQFLLEQRNRGLGREIRGPSGGGTSSHLASDSLRASAILQSVRRHPRFSARSRDHMQRYILERERFGHDTDDRERPSSDRGMSATDRYEATRLAWMMDEPGAYRSRYQRESPPAVHTSGSSPLFQAVISYLAKIRYSETEADSWDCASDILVSKEFAPSIDDFVVNVDELPPPPPTSWLAPGAVFSGSQHATSTSPSCPDHLPPVGTTARYLLNRGGNSSAPSHQAPIAVEMLWQTGSPSDSGHAPPQQDDHWPVRVTVHSVDYDTMTVAATMEAYNVPSVYPTPDPSHATAPRLSSITTYLEGEILDFTTHSFLTESFHSDLDHDALYWSKLEPMKSVASITTNCTDPNNHPTDPSSPTNPRSLPHALTSRAWLTQLQRTHVLMRWKERCFVKATSRSAEAVPSDASPSSSYHSFSSDDDAVLHEDGCGLTINGFYYCSLRRSDGAIEGLYCDPASSPYQHLRLKAVGRGVAPAWDFR